MSHLKNLFFAFLLVTSMLNWACEKDSPIIVTTADVNLTIDENPQQGQMLDIVPGTTNKGSLSFSFISQNPPGAMAIDAASGALAVLDAALFDFEKNPKLSAVMQVANEDVFEKSQITISLNDVNELLGLNDETLSIDENPLKGQWITKVSSNSSANPIQFAISTQNRPGSCSIDAQTGDIFVEDESLFDFELQRTVEVFVEATDGNNSDHALITINLNNVLEEVNTQDEQVSMDENPSQGQSVITVMGTTDLGSVNFSIANESVPGAFDINTNTGELTVLDASLFDYELHPGLTVVVAVTNATITRNAIITVNLNDVFELIWIEENATAAFGGLYGHKVVSFNNKLWCIGGIRNISRLNEVWSNTDGKTWTQENTSPTIFSPRNAHQVVVFNNKLWLIGGFTDNGRSNEVWSSANGTTWSLETTQGIFSPRADHAAVVFNGKIWVVGGSDGNFHNEVWSSSDGINWSKTTTSGNIFTPRLGHTLTVFNGKMFLIAGADLDGQQLLRQRNDIWSSSDGITWTEEVITGNLFVERWIHESIVHKGLLWILGGDDDSGNRFNDVWTSPDGLTWTQQVANPVFSVRDQMAVYLWNNSVWVSGGSNNNGIHTDIWKSN